MSYLRGSIYIFLTLILVTTNSFALKAEYRFEDCNGEKNSKNFTGNSELDGDLEGSAIITNGKIAYGLNLDGSGYMSVPHSSDLDLDDNLTISFWVYPTAKNRQALIVKGNGVGDNRKFGSNAEYSLVLWEDGRFKYKHNNHADTFSKSLISLNKWTHIVLVRDNSLKKIKVYINGVLDNENSYTIEPETSNSEDFIVGSGDYYSDSVNNFKGSIDEIKIYNVVLNDTDISRMYEFESNGKYYSRDCGPHIPPEAQDDKSDLPLNGITSIDVLSNDIVYNGCDLNQSSIELYSDISNAVLSDNNKTLTVPEEGVWSVDVSEGLIKFVSNSNFYDNPTPIYYRVKDSCNSWSNRAEVILSRVVVEPTSSVVTPTPTPITTPTTVLEVTSIPVITPTPAPTSIELPTATPEPTVSVNQVGVNATFRLGDRVWLDDNRNGIQDSKEAGLNGVVVTLFTTDNQKVETVTTDSNGYYIFSNISRGNYYLTFDDIPSGCKFTLKDVGSDDTKDSDVDNSGNIMDIRLDSDTLSNDVGVICQSNEENLTDCDCDDFSSSVPSLSNFYLTILFIIFGFLGFWIDGIKKGSI